MTEQTETQDRVIEVAKSTMTGDLRDIVLEIFKAPTLGKKTWKEMSEQEQRQTVDIIEKRVHTAVVRAIDIVSAEGQRHVKAILKSVTVKDGIKIAAECVKSTELRHELMDAQGDTVLVVMTGVDRFIGERKGVKFDKDQPDLLKAGDQNQETSNGSKQETPHDPQTGEVKEANGDGQTESAAENGDTGEAETQEGRGRADIDG